MKSLDAIPDPTSSTARAPASRRCLDGLAFVDHLLSIDGAVRPAEADVLLDLRHQLSQRQDAEGALRSFCALRRSMEGRHYLAFYRLRRWLESQLVSEVRTCPAATASEVPFRLNGYCVEAIRRQCLCQAVRHGLSLAAPRLQFRFKDG